MINLYVVDYFNIGRANGLSTYVRTLTNGIKSYKLIKLHFIWINSTCYKSFKKLVKSKETHYYIPGHIAIPNESSVHDLKAANFLVKDMACQENVIIHFNWINHCPFACILKQKVKCKVILTKHCIPWRDLIIPNYPLFIKLDNAFKQQKKNRRTPPVLIRERISYDTADHIICVTDYALKVLTDLFHYPPDKITVIRNGLQENILSQNRPKKELLRKKYGFDKEEKIILFAGNVDQRKGVWDLLKAFEALEADYKEKKLRLLIAGPGNHSQMLSQIKRAWTKVTLTGNIEKETLYDLYFLADMGIIPSYVEQCSYTAIEMMQAGLPVIVSNVDGLKEMVPDDCGLKLKLVLGEQNAFIDPDDLKKKICFYIDHKTEAKKYAERARTYALLSFGADQMINKTISVYESLVEKGKSQKTKKLTSVKASPLISILLSCYNAEKYINDCIKSILEQTYSNLEIVLIDDGSTDRTAEVIHQITDPRIHFYRNRVNRGVIYSLNKAVSLAGGKYLARIDADDVMHQDRLLKQVNYLERHSSIAMVGSWHYIIDQFGRVNNIQEYPVNDKDIRLLMLFRNPFSHPSVMIRSSLLKELGYSGDYKHCEDYELWFKIASRYHVANIPEYLTFYRIHNNNTSARYLKQQKQNVMELLSDELVKLGMRPSVQEMIIHAAICFGYRQRYFNSPERIKVLRKWVDKVLSCFVTKNHYEQNYVKRMARIILLGYCGIESELNLEQNPGILPINL